VVDLDVVRTPPADAESLVVRRLLVDDRRDAALVALRARHRELEVLPLEAELVGVALRLTVRDHQSLA